MACRQSDTITFLVFAGEMRVVVPKSGVSSLKKKVPRGTIANRSKDDSGRLVIQIRGLAGLTV
jgi:hypothetical protein